MISECENNLNYLVIGAGGTGGCISAYMTRVGKNVTVIARGEHLKSIQENGLKMLTPEGDYTVNVKASDMEHYNDRPDIIFVCVKGYSLDETILFIERVAKESTIVIPILNIYGTGSRMQEKLPKLLVTDGCIYVASQIIEPGTIQMNGMIFRIVYGVRNEEEFRPELKMVEKDLTDSNIVPILTDKVARDTLKKFAYVSPAATCGQYYDAYAGDMQKPGEIRDTFASLIHEIDILANAMGIEFDIDIVKTNLQILDNLDPDADTSMQRDIRAGKKSEIDGLIYEVPRMAKKYGVTLPTYERIADEIKSRKL